LFRLIYEQKPRSGMKMSWDFRHGKVKVNEGGGYGAT